MFVRGLKLDVRQTWHLPIDHVVTATPEDAKRLPSILITSGSTCGGGGRGPPLCYFVIYPSSRFRPGIDSPHPEHIASIRHTYARAANEDPGRWLPCPPRLWLAKPYNRNGKLLTLTTNG